MHSVLRPEGEGVQPLVSRSEEGIATQLVRALGWPTPHTSLLIGIPSRSHLKTDLVCYALKMALGERYPRKR